MRKKAVISSSILGLLITLASSTPLNADTIYSNFGPGLPSNGSGYVIGGPSANQVIASPFIPTESAILSDAMLVLRQDPLVNTFPVNVYVESSSGGAPGAILDTLTQVGSIGSTSTLVDFTCSACSLLNAGTLYFMVAQQDNHTFPAAWVFSPGPNAITYFNEIGSATGPWTPNTNLPLGAFQVNGVALSPEPTSIALFGTGILGLVAVARRKLLSRS
jgi:hypothetical protein